MPPKRRRPTAAERRAEDALFESSLKRTRLYNGLHSIHRHIHADSETVAIVPKSNLLLPPSKPLQPPPEDVLTALPEDVASDSDKAEQQTRTRQTIDEFLSVADQLADELMDQYADPLMGTTCSCGSQARTVTCFDCFAYSPSCTDCFLKAHRSNPFHWAQVWNIDKGFFQRRDISQVGQGYVIQLGHRADEICPRPSNPLCFQITHTNGVHATRAQFCTCAGEPNKRRQLMKARLLPSTLTDSRAAFTFGMLKVHHVLSLQGKISAFDYIHSLRRLTDNTFTSLVPDPYPSFVRVQRIWEMMTLRKRLGQLHGIDKHFPNRPKGNLTLFCPSCPEPGVNLQFGWEDTPPPLRHLTSINLTLDGNHKVARYTKNTDPNDKSLYEGKAYFPEQDYYTKYIAEAQTNKEKSTCNYLNVVNSQDRKKFRSMDETGMVNCQCDHVNIVSSVDMKYGEASKYPDLALAIALRARVFQTSSVPSSVLLRVSYDIICEYIINILSDNRFPRFFPDVVHRLEDAVWIIPALHIQNHKDDCMYLYSSSYIEGAAHFHGETSEYTWPNSNQIGPQVSQMNKGHRQDKIIDHHSDWNWKKMANQASLLANELVRAWRLFTEKQSHLQQLTRLRLEHVPVWGVMDKKPRKEKGEDVKSPYRHARAKVPTLEAISKHLQEKSKEWLTSGMAVATTVPFLSEAFSIQDNQVRLRHDIKQCQLHPLASLQTSITTLSKQLTLRIDKWRVLQTSTMPSVHRYVANAAPCAIQEEILYLPSDFNSDERDELGLANLAIQEAKLREGDAYDNIQRLQTAVRAVSAMHNRKAKNTTGQAQLTRASGKITHAQVLQTLCELRYAHSREKLIKLGVVNPKDDQSNFPALNPDDLYRNPTEMKRALGATYHRDGKLWTTGTARRDEPSLLSADLQQQQVSRKSRPRPITFTMQSQRESGPHKQSRTDTSTSNSAKKSAQGSNSHIKKNPTMSSAKGMSTASEDKRPSGWIWRVGSGGGLSEEEMHAWELEEDRVQWFRAWAEMSRWLEQFEVKHIEFVRCINSFNSMASAWSLMAGESSGSNPGYAAYARRQSATFDALATIAKETFKEKGYNAFVSLGEGDRIADKILSFRKVELKWLDDAIAGTWS